MQTWLLGHQARLVAFIIVIIAASIFLIIKVFGSNVTVTQPKAVDTVFVNPYTGFAGWADNTETELEHSLVYANVTWKELEPKEGEFDFESFEKENNFDYWREAGKKIIIRPVLDYPEDEAHRDIPDWLYNKIGGRGTVYNNEYGRGFSPDYENSILVEYHRRFILALGERYNKDGFVAFIQMGSVGHWGEWHVNYDTGIKKLPKSDVTEAYILAYVQAFPDKELLIRRPQYITGEYGIGLYNDVIGNKHETERWIGWFTDGYESQQTNETFPAMADFWKHAPSGGEFAESESGVDKYLSGSYIESTLNLLKNSHTSWIGPNSPINHAVNGEATANAKKILRTIGYRFRVSKASFPGQANPGGTLTLDMTWQNDGIAPFYYRWPLEISVIDSAGKAVTSVVAKDDIRTWLPGETATVCEIPLPNDIPEGSYTLTAAILNPETGLPGIRLAQESERDDMRYEIESFNVRKK